MVRMTVVPLAPELRRTQAQRRSLPQLHVRPGRGPSSRNTSFGPVHQRLAMISSRRFMPPDRARVWALALSLQAQRAPSTSRISRPVRRARP